MSKTKLTYTRQDGVALLTLDNPPLNLMTLDMTRELNTAQDGAAGAPQRASGLCGQLTGVGAKLATHSRFALTPRKNAAIFFLRRSPRQ
jgi:hypothetical protein